MCLDWSTIVDICTNSVFFAELFRTLSYCVIVQVFHLLFPNELTVNSPVYVSTFVGSYWQHFCPRDCLAHSPRHNPPGTQWNRPTVPTVLQRSSFCLQAHLYADGAVVYFPVPLTLKLVRKVFFNLSTIWSLSSTTYTDTLSLKTNTLTSSLRPLQPIAPSLGFLRSATILFALEPKIHDRCKVYNYFFTI